MLFLCNRTVYFGHWKLVLTAVMKRSSSNQLIVAVPSFHYSSHALFKCDLSCFVNKICRIVCFCPGGVPRKVSVCLENILYVSSRAWMTGCH